MTPCGVLNVIRENWEEGPFNSKNKIWYALDQRAKIPHLSSPNTEMTCIWQGPFKVTRQVKAADSEVKQIDRGNACQVYHFNLLDP